MNSETEHVSFETLNDLVDGLLDEKAVLAVEQHLAVCSVCAGERVKLTTMVNDVANLPREVLPDDALWSELRAELNRRKDVVLPIANSTVTTHHAAGSGRRSWAILAAAAVVLIALSSGITALVLRERIGGEVAILPIPNNAPTFKLGAPSALRVDFSATEGEYARTIEELRRAFDSQRGQLRPETVKTVEHSLAVVDSAIAEARAALLADPNNRTLVDLLSASYQRKLDLLRRTSELSSRI